MPHNRLWMAALACMWLLPAIAEETAAVTREGIAALIEQLGAEDYFERERAQRALAEIGIEAFDALEEAENHQDLEVADRARYLARRIDIEWVRDGDSTAVKRIMADYGSSSDENRLRKIAELAELPHADGTAALCRVSRFDSSRVRSKFAAVAIFEQKFAADDAEARREAISSNMANSVRPTAEWLRSHVAAQDNAAEALAKMTALAEAEERLLRENPSSTRL